MTANFCLFFAFYLLTPLLPLYLSEHFGTSKDVIGIVLSGYTITALLSRPFSGFIVDSFPRKQVLLVCLSFFFICFAGYLAATSLLFFTLVRTIHGLPFGASTVANSTMAIDVLPSSRRNEGIGYYGLSNNLAMAIAPTAAIWVYHQTNSFHSLFWLALAVAGLALLADATIQTKPQRSIKRSDRPKLAFDRFFLVRGWLLAVNMSFYGFCFGVLSNYLAIYSKQSLGITSGTGTYFLLLAVGLIVSRLFGGRALRQGRLVNHVAKGTLVSSFGYLLFVACSHEYAYYLSALLIGLGNGHVWPAMQNMFIHIARHTERGTANSSILVAWDVGMGLGVLAGGLIAEHFGYGAAFWTVALVQCAGSLLYYVATRRFYLSRRLDEN